MSACGHGATGAGIDRLRHHQAFDEADGVKEGDEEYQIGYNAVEKGEERPRRLPWLCCVGWVNA